MKKKNSARKGLPQHAVTVRVRLDDELAAALRSLESADAGPVKEHARPLSLVLRWLAIQAARTGDINPIVLHAEVNKLKAA